jgi:hypothetical protein
MAAGFRASDVELLGMPERDSKFLGGGPQFNKVGAGVTTDEPVSTPPQGIQAHQIRFAIGVLVILALFTAIWFMSGIGVSQRPVRPAGHIVSPDQQPNLPSNF